MSNREKVIPFVLLATMLPPVCFSVMRICFCFLLLSIFQASFAQSTTYDSVNWKRENLTRHGSLVLGSWGLLNLGVGLIGQRQTTGEQNHFHRANLAWGGVNLALAGIAFFSSRNRQQTTIPASETFRRQTTIEKLFLFNIALDLGYVVFGLYTKERAARFAGEKNERLRGVGNSFLVQGGFLAIFDGVMYLLHTKNGSRLTATLQGSSVGVSQNGLGLLCRF